MSAFDYAVLDGGGGVTRQILSPVRAAAGMVGLALVGLAGWTGQNTLFAKAKKPKDSSSGPASEGGSSAFRPQEGVDSVLIRPGPPVLQALAPVSLDDKKVESCLFFYGDQYEGAIGKGSERLEGWVYGAKLMDGETLARVTGETGDIVKGHLYCWRRKHFLYPDKLAVADKIWDYSVERPQQTDRAVVSVVLKDGNVLPAYWYYYSAAPEAPPVATSAPALERQRTINLKSPLITVFGGMGKLGRMAVEKLRNLGYKNIQVIGRTYPNMKESKALGSGVKFIQLGCESVDCYAPSAEVLRAVADSDVVLNCMGPFQGRQTAEVLISLLTEKKKRLAQDKTETLRPQFYMDVADSYDYAKMCKKLEAECKQLNVTAVTTGGIGPGLSNILVKQALEEHPQGEKPSVIFNYFTAGTGGLGPTILTSSFLLLGQECQIWDNGKQKSVPACSEIKTVNFTQVGPVRVTILNLPEATSMGHTLGLGECKAYFGTAPEIWNSLHVAMAKNIPKKWLQSRDWCANFAKISLVPTRFVEQFTGKALGMKLEVGDQVIDFYHPDGLEVAGIAVAVMVNALLKQGPSTPGVYFPEEFYTAYSRTEMIDDSRKMGCLILGV
eukprot:gb/GEZN01004542.1/.p1 GENE.gb/GEZN01004542.1/~~gb/GEZN01004542.1/.p1  ORF type:complete len:619 (-),score=69.21 gb/GEZN01004542.1/:94-1926(-)